MARPYDGAMTTPALRDGFSHVRRVLPEHWASHRDQRLRMPQEAPDAFFTTDEQVVDRGADQWRTSLEGSVRFWQAVTTDGAVVGGLGLVVEVRDGAAASTAPAAPTGSEIAAPRSGTSLCVVAMFVHPDHRGRGVTRALFARAATGGEGARRDGAAPARHRRQPPGTTELRAPGSAPDRSPGTGPAPSGARGARVRRHDRRPRRRLRIPASTTTRAPHRSGAGPS